MQSIALILYIKKTIDYKQNFKKKTTTNQEIEIVSPLNGITYQVESHIRLNILIYMKVIWHDCCHDENVVS